MAADGSIIIETLLDDKEAKKELTKLNNRIKTLNNQIYTNQRLKMPLVEQSKQAAANLDLAMASLEKMKSAPVGAYTAQQIAQQEETVKSLQYQYSKIQSRVEAYDRSISTATEKLNIVKEQAGAIQQNMAAAGVDTEKMEAAAKRASKGAMGFATQLKYAMSSILLYGALFQVFSKFTEWMGKVIKSNGQASAAVAKLKGALLTLAQPLLGVLIPAFTVFVQILTSVVSTLAQLFAMLTGTTIDSSKNAAKALDDETKALEGTGAAAKKASKSLASFDEINKLSGDGAAGGGVAADTGIQPDFNFDADLTDSQLRNILGLIEAIGTAFLTWKISKALGLNLKETLGLALAIYSAIQLVKNIFSAWIDGVNWNNLTGILLSTAGLVSGLYVAFGKLGAAIGLVVSGVAMLVTGFKDAFTNGWNLQNLLLTIAGIMAAGLGISILTGSFIPALIAAIASVVLAFTVAAGNGEELLLGIQTILCKTEFQLIQDG